MIVSVIIPVYNAAPFLDKSVETALDQKQTGEVILIDDRSTDGSWEKCETWVRKDKRVRLFRNEGVQGAGAARNVGLRNATCEYIAFLDADDYFLEGRFNEDERLYATMKHVVSIAGSVINKSYNEKDVFYINRFYRHNEICGGLIDFEWVSISNLLYESSIKITGLSLKRSIAQALGGFNERLKQGEDTDFLVRLISNYSLFTSKVNVPICVRNIHLANTIGNIAESIYYRKIVLKKFLNLSIFKLNDFHLANKLLKSYLELEYFNIFKERKILCKKMIKIIISPVTIFKFFFITKSIKDHQNL
jgi:glycosyltransferase involved in cell wall biosynthesis